MKIKAYFANTVEAAVQRAGEELGEGALLLGAKTAPPEHANLGRYEVTFGIAAEETAAVTTPEPSTPAPSVTENPVDSRRYADDLDGIRRQLEELRASLHLYHGATPPPKLVPPFAWMFNRLLQSGMDAPLAADLLLAAQQRFGTAGRREPLGQEIADAVKALSAEMTGRIKLTAGIAAPSEGRQAIALVGPPGAGKTLTTIRVAIRYGLARKRTVRLISVDGGRIGGGLVLRSYAELLGIDHVLVDNGADLARVLAEKNTASAELTLIDTPGFSPHEDGLAETASHIRACSSLRTLLVLPAAMSAPEMQATAGRFARFNPLSLVLTRLDEAESLTGAYMGLIGLNLPVALMCSGQQVPEGVEEASADRLVENILSGLMEPAAKAA
jgi:flagellar biosynthesis protein FlhF